MWWLSGNRTWPKSFNVPFFLQQIIIAGIFASLWAVLTILINFIVTDTAFTVLFETPQKLLWKLFIGVWIYGCVISISYAIRNHIRAQAEEKRALEAHALFTETQLNTLKSRLQPHFLFNALNSVTSLISKDPIVAEEHLIHLSDLLRFILEKSEMDWIEISDEIKFIKDYWRLESARQESPPELILNIQPHVLSKLIPPLLLQPIIENSLRHGNLATRQGAFIKVDLKTNSDQLIICISDNGIGAHDTCDLWKKGVGLSSVKERLKRIYAQKASVSIETQIEAGFSVCIILPLNNT